MPMSSWGHHGVSSDLAFSFKIPSLVLTIRDFSFFGIQILIIFSYNSLDYLCYFYSGMVAFLPYHAP